MTSRTFSVKLIVMKIEINEIELRKLDLNLLLVFSALMREGGVTKAANRLYLGPSAVSMALSRLREEVGDPLFVKTNKGMEPTSRAHQLWEDVAPSLAAIEAAVRAPAAFDPLTSDTVIRFAAPDDLEFVLVPRLLERMAKEAPNMRLVVRPSDFRTLLWRLDENDADLALSATPTSGIEKRHRVQVLHQETFLVLFDKKQLGSKTKMDLDTFVETPHLLLTITGDLHGLTDEALAELGKSRQVLAGITHFPTAPFILKRRPSIICVPATAARHFAQTYDLDIAPMPIPPPTFDVSLLWHGRTDNDPAQAWFRELVEEEVGQISQ